MASYVSPLSHWPQINHFSHNYIFTYQERIKLKEVCRANNEYLSSVRVPNLICTLRPAAFLPRSRPTPLYRVCSLLWLVFIGQNNKENIPTHKKNRNNSIVPQFVWYLVDTIFIQWSANGSKLVRSCDPG